MSEHHAMTNENSKHTGNSDRYINRELSWLAFNMRVLQEAENIHHPLLERVKFLSISASNLDEFYTVRVAGLKEMVRDHISRRSTDGLTPSEQLARIHSKAADLMDQQRICWNNLQQDLAKKQVHFVSATDLNPKDKRWLKNHFEHNIFPAISPLAIDPAHPFPFLPNLSIAIILHLCNANGKAMDAVIPLPQKLDRFIRLPGKQDRFVRLEEIIHHFLGKIFCNYQLKTFAVIHVLRDSDLEIEDEAEDLVSTFETAVKRRKRGSVICLKYCGDNATSMKQFIQEKLQVDADEMLEQDPLAHLAAIMEIYNQCDRPELKFGEYAERFPERINDFHGDCFAAIAAKDLVVHHPYESFDVVVRFLQQAAADPDVITIKQTLYRTSNDSPIVKALIAAAEAGKSVTCVVELKARFDEEANIRWARDLERAGAQVTYGFVALKTHAKMSLIVRREGEKLVSYAHVATGNYHPITARIYSDLSFFTCNADLCRDAGHLFNFLTGYAPPKTLHALSMSPEHLRTTLKQHIDQEIAHAKAGRPATIWAKLNALVDPDIIDALYTASQAGVTIDLVVRGICTLRPGIEGLSENIRVKSIVGRFLEHARIVCFGNGHALPSEHATVFISSADWMQRNFDRRIEILIPITNPTVHEQIMGQIMVANLNDARQSWVMHGNGSYSRVGDDKKSFCAHQYFMTNPSLSGRGKALTEKESQHKRKKIYRLFRGREKTRNDHA